MEQRKRHRRIGASSDDGGGLCSRLAKVLIVNNLRQITEQR
jgi:hypothetical protein